MKVDILEHLEDGTQRRIATFQWRENELNCDNPVLWKHLMNSSGGVIIGARGKRYYPRDGAEYLRNLKYQFAGPYLFAQPPRDSEIPESSLRTSSGSTLTGAPPVAPIAPPVVPREPVVAREPMEESRGPRPPTQPNPSARSQVPVTKGREPVRKSARDPRDPREASGARDPRDTREPRKDMDMDAEPDVPRQAQENICAGVFRLSAALRGISLAVAHGEADQLLKMLAELVQIDLAALKRAYESREEYLELRYQPPSRLNYPKVWDRLNRSWQAFLDVLEQGDLAASLWPLFLVREGLAILPEHRSEWIQSSSLLPISTVETAGTSLGDLNRGWGEVGMPAFRKKGLSSSLLDEVYTMASEPFGRALAAFQQANFGLSEVELRQALMIDPGHCDARLLLGDLLRRMDRTPEALAELQQTVETEHLALRTPQAGTGRPPAYLRMARARVCIGRSLLGLGRVREAGEQLEKGLECLDWLSRKNPTELLEEAERQQLREELSTIHRLLEPIYRALGETERADHHRKRFGTSTP